MSLIGTATVWQEMDGPPRWAESHRCAYSERLGFGPFTDRMMEKCTCQTALYSSLFHPAFHWGNPVNEDSA